METKRKPSPVPLWESKGYVFPAVILGLVILGICLVGMGALLLISEAREWMVTLLAVIALCLTGYFTGYVTGHRRKHHGLWCGIIVGAALYGVLLLVGLIVFGEAGTWLRPVCLCASSGFGGVAGVNGGE